MRTTPPPSRRSETGTIRARTALAAAGLLVVALGPAIAFANLTGSTFESNDGDLTHTGTNLDWDNAPNRQAGIEQYTGSLDNSFGQGTKEDDTTPTVVTGSIPPNKSDLTRFYIANNDSSSGHKFLYLAWERTNTLGSANMDFEINQLAQPDMTTTGTKDVGATRSAGDLLVRYDFSGGGTVPTLSLVKWLKGSPDDSATSADCNSSGATLPCWGALPGSTEDGIDGVNDNQIDLTSAGFAEGAVNVLCSGDKKCTDTTTDPIADPNIALPSATFGEAGIDLTAAGVFKAGVCTNFGSAYLKSRSSDSFTAETKDFVAPISISINNCGNLTIKKVTIGGSGAFGYTSNTLADQTPSDSTTKFTLTTTGAGTANAASTGNTYHGILAGTYDATENSKTGWTLTALSCVNSDGTPHAATTDLTARSLSVAIAVGDDVTCTFTNTAKATLRIDKVTVPSGDSQLFTFDEGTSLGGGTFQLADATTPKAYTDITPGTYSVSEEDPGSTWDLTARACVLTGTTTTHTADTSSTRGVSVTLSPGEDVTCTFTNTKRGALTIKKTDDDDPANVLSGVGFTLYTDNAPVGPQVGVAGHGTEDTATTMTCTTGASGTCTISDIPPGHYWVVETTTKSGYASAADQAVNITAGYSNAATPLTFVDPRQFHVITLVCQNSDNSLYPSSVTLDSSTKTSLSASDLAAFNTANGTNLTADQLCSLTGARFGPKGTGTYSGSVTIAQ